MKGPVVSRLVVAAMFATLAGYIVLHSPLRETLSTLLLGRSAHTSYFTALFNLHPATPASAVTALLAIVAALLAGASVADRIAWPQYEWPLVFGVTAFACIVVPAAALGGIAAMTNIPLLRAPVGPALVAAPALFVAGLAVAGGWRPRTPRLAWPGRSAAVPLGAALLLLAASAAVAISQPPTGFDALAYHGPLSVYFWRDGDIVSYLERSVSGFALALPGSAELWFGLLLLAGGERLANLGQLPFSLLGALAVRAIARRNGARPTSAALAGSAFLLAPVVALQSGMQLNDVAAASLVIAAGALACAPVREWTVGRGALVGLAAALAATTKVAVLPAVAAVLLFGAGRLLLDTTAVRRVNRTILVGVVLAFALSVAPWWIRNVVRYGNPVYPAAIPFIGHGVVVGDFAQKDDHFVPTRVAWPLYPLLEPLNDQSGFGPLLIVAAAPGLLLAATRPRRRRAPIVLFTVVAAFSLPLWWTQTQHEPRHLLAPVGMAFAFLPCALALRTAPFRRVTAGLTAAAALFSAVSTADQALIPRTGSHLDRLQFYDVVWNIDPVVASAPESVSLLYHTGFASLSYAGDYPLLGPSHGRQLVTIDGDVSTDTIVRTMRSAQLRYAYVPASPSVQSEVEGRYPASLFAVEHVSEVDAGERVGTRRYLFRLLDSVDHAKAVPSSPFKPPLSSAGGNAVESR